MSRGQINHCGYCPGFNSSSISNCSKWRHVDAVLVPMLMPTLQSAKKRLYLQGDFSHVGSCSVAYLNHNILLHPLHCNTYTCIFHLLCKWHILVTCNNYKEHHFTCGKLHLFFHVFSSTSMCSIIRKLSVYMCIVN